VREGVTRWRKRRRQPRRRRSKAPILALGPVGPIPAGPIHLWRLPRTTSLVLLWAGNFPASKIGLSELGPLTLTTARGATVVIAGVVLTTKR
jgi:hypothetical protein